MTRGYGFVGLAALLLAPGCIDFEATREAYCQSISPQSRAEICQDGPRVFSMEPARNATDVALDAAVTVTFSEAVDCDPTGIALLLDQESVPGSTTCAGDTRAVFTHPASFFLSGRVYTVNVTSGIRDKQGTPALPLSWTFLTR